MRTSRLIGLAVAVAGASLLGFLFSQLLDRSGEAHFVTTIGLPGVLVLGALGSLSVVFGVQAWAAPGASAKRRTTSS